MLRNHNAVVRFQNLKKYDISAYILVHPSRSHLLLVPFLLLTLLFHWKDSLKCFLDQFVRCEHILREPKFDLDAQFLHSKSRVSAVWKMGPGQPNRTILGILISSSSNHVSRVFSSLTAGENVQYRSLIQASHHASDQLALSKIVWSFQADGKPLR